MTLIEVLVSIVIMSLLAGALLAAADIGVRTLGKGGAADRSAGAHDFSAFEQQLGEDVTRASCIRVASTSYGACSRYVSAGSMATTCAAAKACIAWSQHSDESCHVAVYAQSGSNTTVTRTEYSNATGGTPKALGSHNVTELHPRDTTSLGATVALTATTVSPTPPSGVSWLSALGVTLTGTGITYGSGQQVTDTLSLHPYTTDPGGQREISLC